VALYMGCGSSSSTECGLGGFKCVGAKAYTCGANSMWKIKDCGATLGMTCESDATGAYCVPLGPDKECGIGGFQCKDNIAFNCDATTSKWKTTDCSATVGQTCQCTNAGCTCVPFVSPAECGMGGFKCEKNKAYTCGADSKWVIVDCSATIGTTCKVSAMGASCEAI
ncbi:MAG: hypothetical protein WC889_16230, partial [Myxococcota bacterium]